MFFLIKLKKSSWLCLEEMVVRKLLGGAFLEARATRKSLCPFEDVDQHFSV